MELLNFATVKQKNKLSVPQRKVSRTLVFMFDGLPDVSCLGDSILQPSVA